MASEKGSSARALEILGCVAAFAPAAACAALVVGHVVDVPVWDDWERAKLIEHGFDWAYLYSPHIDHRILIPRLVALANARWFGGDLRLEMGLSFVVLLVTALGVFALLRKSFGRERPAALYGTAFLANALIFSPLQWENLLWAAQPFFLWPMAAVVLALVLLGSRLRLGWKLVLALVLTVLTTHTFSHGLGLWLLVPAALLLQRGGAPARARVAFLAVWLLAGAAILVPYFTVGGMRNTSEPSHSFGLPTGARVPHRSLTAVGEAPLATARFATTMLGSPLARLQGAAPRDVAPPAGAAVLLFFALGAGAWLARWRDAEAFGRGLPWVLLGGYGLALCALTALGRAPVTSWSYALLPHYVSIGIYPLLAALPLGLLALARTRPRGGPLAPFVGGFLAVVVAVGWIEGVRGMDEWRSARLQAHTALLYQPLFRPHYIRRLDGSRDVVARFAPVLDRHGQLHPPLKHEPTLDGFQLERTPLREDVARVQEAGFRGRTLRVSGYAWLPDAGRRADGILFVVREPGGSRRVIGTGELHGPPWFDVPEYDNIFNEVALPGPPVFGAFVARIPASHQPAESPFEVEVWAVDMDRMRLHPFPERLRVERTAGGGRVERFLPRGGKAP